MQFSVYKVHNWPHIQKIVTFSGLTLYHLCVSMSLTPSCYTYHLSKIVPDDREGNGTPLQYSCLENPMDGGGWWAAVHGVAKSQTRLSDFTFTFHFHALEKEMAIHSSVLAWRIPGTGEPGGLLSMGSHRVGHDWSNLAAVAAAVPDEEVEELNNLSRHTANKC